MKAGFHFCLVLKHYYWQIIWAPQKIKKVETRTGKFLFRDIITKMKNKSECYQYLCLLNNPPKVKIALVKQVNDH